MVSCRLGVRDVVFPSSQLSQLRRSVLSNEQIAPLSDQLKQEGYLFFPKFLPEALILKCDSLFKHMGVSSTNEELGEAARAVAEIVQNLLQKIFKDDETVKYIKGSRVFRGYTKGLWTGVHMDAIYAGPGPIITTWLPLMPISVNLGGLVVLPWQAERAVYERLRPVRSVLPTQVKAAGDKILTYDPWVISRTGWASENYEVGDLVVFREGVAHMSLCNMKDTVRRSMDMRWVVGDVAKCMSWLKDPTAKEEVDLPQLLVNSGFTALTLTREQQNKIIKADAECRRRNARGYKRGRSRL